MSPENRANVQFALMKMMKTACSNLSPAVLWLSSRRSHYHLQGQGGGGGAACGEGGHYHLGVDGLLPVLRVHAQHRHLRPGQVAGETELLECVCVAGSTNKALTHKHSRQWWSRGFTVRFLLHVSAVAQMSRSDVNDLASYLSSRLQASDSAHEILYYVPGVRIIKSDGWPVCVRAMIPEAFLFHSETRRPDVPWQSSALRGGHRRPAVQGLQDSLWVITTHSLSFALTFLPSHSFHLSLAVSPLSCAVHN